MRILGFHGTDTAWRCDLELHRSLGQRRERGRRWRRRPARRDSRAVEEMSDPLPVETPATEAENSDPLPVEPPATENDEPLDQPAMIEVPTRCPARPRAAPTGWCGWRASIAAPWCRNASSGHPEWTAPRRAGGRRPMLAIPRAVAVRRREDRAPSFCMDRYEYLECPWRAAAHADVRSGEQAAGLCAAEGKRLCTEAGSVSRAKALSRSLTSTAMSEMPRRAIRTETTAFPTTPAAAPLRSVHQQNARCAAELARLDGREPAGGRAECASWAGVSRPERQRQRVVWCALRSKALTARAQGRWWGPIRSAVARDDDLRQGRWTPWSATRSASAVAVDVE